MTSDEKAIRKLVATWMSATKAGDLETVLGLMTEDIVFPLPGHAPMIGKAAYASAAGGRWVLARDANLVTAAPV